MKIKKSIYLFCGLIIYVISFCLPVYSGPLKNDPKIPKYASDRILVSFNPGTPGATKRDLHSQAGGNVSKSMNAINLEVVAVPDGSVLDKIKLYQKNPNVKYAQPDYYRTLVLPGPGTEGVEPNPALGDY